MKESRSKEMRLARNGLYVSTNSTAVKSPLRVTIRDSFNTKALVSVCYSDRS
jgi:hypothetical protein